jgi:hypothetical protein
MTRGSARSADLLKSVESVRKQKNQILISDGYEVVLGSEATPGTSPTGGIKYFLPTLDKAWCEAEEKVDPKTDTWGDMMVWTMFQEFHSAARNLIQQARPRLGHAKSLLPR